MSASVPSRRLTSSPFSRRCCTRFGAAAAFATVTGTSSSWVATERASASFSTRMKNSGASTGPISRLFTSVRRSRRVSRSSFSMTVRMARIIRAPGVADGGDERVLERGGAEARAQRLRRAGGDDRPLVHDHDVVAQRGDLLHDVAREQDAVPGAAQLLDQRAQGARRHHVEPVRRLVEQQVLRRVHQRARERDLDALALREALRAAVGDRAEVELGDERLDARRERGAGEAVQPAEVGDVLARGELRVDAGAVRQHADPAARGQRVGLHVDAVDDGRAGVGPQHGVEDAQASWTCRRRSGRAGP